MARTTLKTKAKAILSALGSRNDYELSLTIVDDNDMADLNLSYRSKEGPTNVISFPMGEGMFSDITPHLLGDVVISIDTAEREATEAGITLDERLSQLLIHGVLHLFGYDHEISEDADREMASKSLELLRLIEKNTDLDFF